MNNSSNHEQISVVPRVRFRAVAGEGVLVHLDSGRVIVVNDVGLHILKMLETPITRQNLATSIMSEFDVSCDQANTDLDLYLDELNKEEVLQGYV